MSHGKLECQGYLRDAGPLDTLCGWGLFGKWGLSKVCQGLLAGTPLVALLTRPRRLSCRRDPVTAARRGVSSELRVDDLCLVWSE